MDRTVSRARSRRDVSAAMAPASELARQGGHSSVVQPGPHRQKLREDSLEEGKLRDTQISAYRRAADRWQPRERRPSSGMVAMAETLEVDVLAEYPVSARLSVCSTLMAAMQDKVSEGTLALASITASAAHVAFALSAVNASFALPFAHAGVDKVVDRALKLTFALLASGTLAPADDLRALLQLGRLFRGNHAPTGGLFLTTAHFADARVATCRSALAALRAGAANRGAENAGASSRARHVARHLARVIDDVLADVSNSVAAPLAGELFETVVDLSLRAVADVRRPAPFLSFPAASRRTCFRRTRTGTRATTRRGGSWGGGRRSGRRGRRSWRRGRDATRGSRSRSSRPRPSAGRSPSSGVRPRTRATPWRVSGPRAASRATARSG